MPEERVIWGPPGTGKTTAGIELVRGWFRTMSPDEVAYLGFTRASAKEALSRILDEHVSDARMKEKAPYFRTIHSLAYMGLLEARDDVRVVTTADMKRFSKETGLDGRFSVHEWEDLAEIFQSLRKKGRTPFDDALTAYKLSRIECTCEADLARARKSPGRLAQRTMGYIEDCVYEMVIRKYETFKAREGLVDFTDMLEFALVEMKPFQHIRRVIVDECQDLSAIHHALITKLFQHAEEIWWVGDDDQCQPKDTKVVLSQSGKTKRISELKNGDSVLSFDRPGYALVKRKVTKTSSRRYSGPLLTVMAGPYFTQATPNHRFLVRWTKDARFGKACATYLMERDGKWRVGWCQLFNCQGSFHFNLRMNHELAHRGWILKVHADRTEASIYESIVSARYGLPTCLFEPVKGNTHQTREAIDEIFRGIGDRREQAIDCLKDHGRLVEHPIVDKVKRPGRHRSTLIETQACNLIDDLMAAPTTADGKTIDWKPLRVRVKQVKDLRVYSLKVDQCETYVADGIITHNSIYTFCGARADLFLDRAARATSQIQLRQTHRFGQDLVDYSRLIIRKVDRRQDKQVFGLPGSECIIRSSGEFRPTSGNMLILHRHVQGCQAIAASFMGLGMPFRNERGKDPLSSTNRIKSWEALNRLASGDVAPWGQVRMLLEELMPTIHINDDHEKIRLLIHGAKVRLQEQRAAHADLDDLLRFKILTDQGYSAIRGRKYGIFKHTEDLEYYHRVVENGFSLDPKGSPVISTIHGSKGRQAPHVVVFNEMGRRCWEDRDSEHRLAYVAATRAQVELEICHERSVDWAETEYPYPNEEDFSKQLTDHA